MEDKREGGLATADIWKRGLLMLLFVLAFSVAHALLNLLAVVQFFWLLLAKEPNRFLLRFGKSFSIWFADVTQFLTCATDEKPFPWKDWPNAG